MFYRNEVRQLESIKRVRIPPTPSGHMRLHRGERPVGLPPFLEASLLSGLPHYPIQQYPDYLPVKAAISSLCGVSDDRVVMGQGIEDLIRSLIWMTCGYGDVVSFTYPTCAMFEIHTVAATAEPQFIRISPDDPPDPEQLCNAVWPGASMLILPNPGQPVDLYYDRTELAYIAMHCRENERLLVIDEAYWGFGSETAIPLTEQFDNVIVLRTFSKAWAAAGIRVGWAVGSPKAIKPLEAIRLSGEISGLSAHVALRILESLDDMNHQAALVAGGRDYLRNALTDMGIPCRGTKANHVLIKFPSAESCQAAGQKLLGENVHVKFGFPFPVEKHMLVTCGPIDLMRDFLRKFLPVHSWIMNTSSEKQSTAA